MNKSRWMYRLLPVMILLFFSVQDAGLAQQITFNTAKGLKVAKFQDREGQLQSIPGDLPFFSFIMNGNMANSLQANVMKEENRLVLLFGDSLECEVFQDSSFHEGSKVTLIFYNKSADTIDLENIVPFGESPDHLYITSTGPWALARAKLFLPGRGPVGVILPDNAWELGYAHIETEDGRSLCALSRRTGSENGDMRRYRTVLYPEGTVEYTIYIDDFQGDWQVGLKLMFYDHYLYDLDDFDDTLFDREDLSWIRGKYIIGLEFAWNKEFYDWKRQQYHYFSFLEKGMHYFGGYDVFGLWPTWPRLGVDQRNQWDLFSDMPGGLQQLKYFSQEGKKMGTKFFICYNPWDESTRHENPYTGMASLIDALDADGVVLDCHGASSFAYQHAADSIKPGVIMYSEGMAVVKDMPGIVAGRVHDAIYLPPPLNLNKLIKPEFAIFRVCQIHDGRIRREASIAFFNGYGTELNTFAPGQFETMEEDLLYLGRTTMTLRENSDNFLSDEWTPLIPAIRDSIWVNEWPKGDKTLFTIFSLVPEGYEGALFEKSIPYGYHAVSLWHHQELDEITIEGKKYLPVKLEAFNRYDLGTRTEGNVDCIAILPDLLRAELVGDTLKVDAKEGEEIRIWAGMPSYQNPSFLKLEPGWYDLNILQLVGNYEGKLVIQLFEKDALLDERVVNLGPGQPRLMAFSEESHAYAKAPEGMVNIPAGTFSFSAENTDQFIPYPDPRGKSMVMKAFYIDIYPVTNAQFREFLDASGYVPEDTVNFLKHWTDRKIPEGLEDHPVVYVSLEDARAYAAWAGKRLPTEAEWQYAGQGTDARKWPWGEEFIAGRCNDASGHTTAVNKFPKGKSPYGVRDMVGNVWQLTADVYDNGTYYFAIMKGGSYYKPTSSWWYVKGGPQALDWHQQLLLVGPGFDRNATVGFRCAADAAQ